MNILFHPAAVHLPLGLAFILPLVTLWILWKHPKAWSLVVILLGLQVAGTHLGLYTGERIEHAYEEVRGEVMEPSIHEHEELAEGLLILSWLGLALGIGGLVVPERFRSALRLGTLLLALLIAAQGARTGHAGGTLVYGPNFEVPGTPGHITPSPGTEGDAD